jgi:hypothetical protein
MYTKRHLNYRTSEYTEEKHYAPKNFDNFEALLKSIKIDRNEFYIENGFAHGKTVFAAKAFKIFRDSPQDGESKQKDAVKKVITDKYYMTVGSAREMVVQAIKDIAPIHVIEWSPRLKSILGLDEKTDKYTYPIFEQAGSSNLYIYCDIIEPQRVGHTVVPLLRKITNTGYANTFVTREFQHLQYIDVARLEFDQIHMYIKTESGGPPSFTVGTFSATLHFRRKRY